MRMVSKDNMELKALITTMSIWNCSPRFIKQNLFGSKFNGSLMIGNSALTSRMYDNNAWNSGEPGLPMVQSSNSPWTVPNKYFLSNTTGTLNAPT